MRDKSTQMNLQGNSSISDCLRMLIPFGCQYWVKFVSYTTEPLYHMDLNPSELATYLKKRY